jgi:hypothetical protein
MCCLCLPFGFTAGNLSSLAFTHTRSNKVSRKAVPTKHWARKINFFGKRRKQKREKSWTIFCSLSRTFPIRNEDEHWRVRKCFFNLRFKCLALFLTLSASQNSFRFDFNLPRGQKLVVPWFHSWNTISK